MLDLDLLLKSNELCVVGRDRTRANMHEAGLYVRDTRFLSGFSLAFRGEPLLFLDNQTPAADIAIITSTNPPLKHLELGIDPQSVLVRQQITLDTALVVTLTIRNFGKVGVTGDLDISLAADFRDMFDIRGMTPKERATPQGAIRTEDGVTLMARGTDGVTIGTRISSSEPATIIDGPESDDECAVTLRYPLDLPRDATREIEIRISPEPVGAPLERPSAVDITSPFAPHIAIESPSDAFDTFIAQSDADLALLQTSFPDGNIPAAGIPWFIAPFGRDSLIVGLQTMHAYPVRIASTLRVLAAQQGTTVDEWREEQPGKILHEVRYGDMARTNQVPHTPYYGSVDSTPLFVMVFAQHYLWHRDERLYDDLIDNVRRALVWIEEWGDLDGDGFVEFTGEQRDIAHIAQQGWKDSGDSLHFADGTHPKGPIALVEVQGYVYAAYRWLSDAVRLRGDHAWADELAAKAESIRTAVESRFWMESDGFYAQALDGEKRQVDAISSNPGHLLFCELPSPERAERVAERLAADDLHTGWGLRTLSSRMATYNPMSYHNGSIWPHDTSLAMAGLRAYGHNDFSLDFAKDLLKLAADSPNYRLAELYCGFPEMDVTPGVITYPVGPVDYPVSCSPQAWAAGAGLLVLRTLLGLRADPERRALAVDPHLPAGWDRMVVKGLKFGGNLTNVFVERDGAGYSVKIDHDESHVATALATPEPVI